MTDPKAPLPDEAAAALDDLADRFILQCALAWEGKGLPLNAFATAATTWGLQFAIAEASPSEVAEGLQRMADAVIQQNGDVPRHLI